MQAYRNSGATADAGGGAAASGGGAEAESLSTSETFTQRELASQHSQRVLPAGAAKHTQVGNAQTQIITDQRSLNKESRELTSDGQI